MVQFLLTAFVIALPIVTSRSIEVQLTAPWPTTAISPVLEVSEFMAEESPDTFWNFVSALRQETMRAALNAAEEAAYSEDDHEQLASLAVEIAADHLPPLQLAALRLTLAVRSFAPLVETHRSLAQYSYNACGDWEDTSAAAWVILLPWGTVVCDVAHLSTAVSAKNASELPRAATAADHWVKSVDHSYPGQASGNAPRAVLYARLGTDPFWEFHDALALLAEAGDVTYSLRHGVPPVNAATKTTLQGYGVNLDIKNMEYKNLDDGEATAKDESGTDDDDGQEAVEEIVEFEEGEEISGFDFHTLHTRRPDLGSELSSFRKSLLEEARDSGAAMKVWKMKDLGLQAVSSIMSSKDPLRRLVDLCQDFPVHAHGLSSIKVPKPLRGEVQANAQADHMEGFRVGSTLYVNGRPVDMGLNTFNLFTLLQTIRSETRILERIDQLGLPAAAAQALVDVEQSDAGDGDGPPLRIDVVSGSKGAIHFVNNLEKDPQYKRWPKTMRQLLFPSWSLHTLARNLYTSIVIVDPTTDEGLTLLSTVEGLFRQSYPVRFGIVITSMAHNQAVLASHEDESSFGKLVPFGTAKGNATAADIAVLMSELKNEHGVQVCSSFLFALSAKSAPVTLKEVIAEYATASSQAEGSWTKGKFESQALGYLEEAAKGQGKGLASALRMATFANSKGVPVNCFLMNGILETDLQQGLMQLLGREQQMLGELVQAGKFAKSKGGPSRTVLQTLMAENNVFPRYHPLVSQAPAEKLFLVQTEEVTRSTRYLHSSKECTPKAMSLLLLDDWSTSQGRQRLLDSLEHAGTSEDSRLAPLLSLSGSLDAGDPALSAAIQIQSLVDVITASSYGGEDAIAFLKLAIKAIGVCLDESTPLPTPADLTEIAENASYLEWPDLSDKLPSAVDTENIDAIGAPAAALQRELGKSRDEYSAVVIANGRCIFVTEAEPFTLLDLELLTHLELESRGHEVHSILERFSEERILDGNNCDSQSDAVAISASFLGEYKKQPREDLNQQLSHRRTKFTYLETESSASTISSVVVTAVLDPLTEAAQRAAPLLMVLRDQLQVPIRLFLTPEIHMSEFPLQKFYRYVVGADVEDVTPRAIFEDLPRSHILTMRMDTPEPWNVQSAMTVQDVDNLRCDDVTCGDEAGSSVSTIEYTLKSLLVGGQCFDTNDHRPPNGLQIKLSRRGDEGAPHSDTVVMQNLGYFQLAAFPGVWRLNLAAGRASDLFSLEDATDGGLPVVVTSFYDTVTQLKVKRQKGKEKIKLLDDIQQSETSEDVNAVDVSADGQVMPSQTPTFSRVSSSLFGSKPSVANDTNADKEKIHVFSLATGHLYERFLKIMMLSVVKRSSMPIKFWLFENYLSPTFKRSAEVMAEEYGFELGFVTYKWPSWLRQQTSKQRIIWGYKILFLDVLFPLNVNKVIYVDSDQTVRGDLAELWKMDLKGRPYAYTPFCESKKETLGYQFWRQGYWKDHLRGRPYHISALYVVDLNRFRRMAVGDQLRSLYDNLSRDPNSLANLDQDLPNYAQNMIPIHSLPQEWLWCESWCSEETKGAAKTIDLCNNPMYKEPKLEMAKRVIQGSLFKESWVELDEEIRSLESRANVGVREATTASYVV